MSTDPQPEKPDQHLLAEARRGDASSARLLSDRYWQPIFRFCMSYLSDEALAEDVTQETYAKLTAGDDPPSGEIKPWLYKVARNHCLDILRRHQRSPTHGRPLKTGFDAAGSSRGPSTKAADHERHDLMRQIIADMPEEYRSVLTLKYFENLSREEIAEVLGITDIAVKGRLARASEHLRDEMRKFTRMEP